MLHWRSISNSFLSGADPELHSRGVWPRFVVFSCEKFLNTVVCYWKYYCLGGAMDPWPSSRSAPVYYGALKGLQNFAQITRKIVALEVVLTYLLCFKC